MATIGNFQLTGEEFNGQIVTLSLQAKKVRIVPDTRASRENAPSHRVLVDRVEFGAGWSKKSNEGRAYLGLKLDDPSFTAQSTPTSSPTKAVRATASSGLGRTVATATDKHRMAPRKQRGVIQIAQLLSASDR